MVPTNYTLYKSQIFPVAIRKKNVSPNLGKTYPGAHRVLFRARTVFPFDFFPDEIVIDENKIDMIYGIFFFSTEVFSISVKNIYGAMSITNLFFGSLEVEVSGYNKNPDPMKYLWGKDAAKARRIINGLVCCYKQGINTSVMDIKAAKVRVEEIGKALEAY